jgi:hypothetical protein
MRGRNRDYLFSAADRPDPRSIILALVNGLDIMLVHPALYPLINSQIEGQIARFQDTKDQFSIDKLHEISRYINEEHPAQEERTRILIVPPKPPPPKPQPFSPTDLAKNVESVLTGQRRKNYTQIEMEALLAELRVRRKAALKMEDYIEAERIAYASTQLLRRVNSYTVVKFQEAKTVELTLKLEEAQKKLADLEFRWRNVMQHFRMQRDQELHRIYANNIMAIEELEGLKSEPLPPKFNKRSPALLNLRQRERAMISSRRYDDAAIVQVEADRLQSVEDEKNRHEWISDVDLQIEKLTVKLNQMFAVRRFNLEKEEHGMVRQRKRELASARKTVEHLKKTIKHSELPSIEGPEPAVKLNDAGLPTLNFAVLNNVEERSPKTFRKRALLNMRVYTKVPPKTGRNSNRK